MIIGLFAIANPRFRTAGVFCQLSTPFVCPNQNFAALGLEELQESINSRRNRIFLLMEEVPPQFFSHDKHL